MIVSASEDYGYEKDDILADAISSFAVFASSVGQIAGPIFVGLLTDYIGLKTTCAIAAGINIVAGVIFAFVTKVFSFSEKKYKTRKS
jgi:MFS family permease